MIYIFKSATLFSIVLISFIYIPIHIFYIYFKTLVFVLLYTYMFYIFLIVICCEAPRTIMDVALYQINRLFLLFIIIIIIIIIIINTLHMIQGPFAQVVVLRSYSRASRKHIPYVMT